MQNFDYYHGSTHYQEQPEFVARDPEYFSRMARNHQKEGVKKRNKATRFLSFVLALCIVSFTTGIIVGMKFTGGDQQEIVDPATKQAMSDIGTKVNNLTNENEITTETATEDVSSGSENSTSTEVSTSTSTSSTSRSYPKELFPYVIRIGNKYSKVNAEQIADYLSSKGHTVILSQHEDFFRVYTGPYKEKSSAQVALNRINYYTDNKYFHSAMVLKR
jgi:hypothetical protein